MIIVKRFWEYLAKELLSTRAFTEYDNKDSTTLLSRINAISAKAERNRERINAISAKAEQNRERIRHPFFPPAKMYSYMESESFTIEQKKWFINKRGWPNLGYWQNLDNPKSFNEKTNWYKLHYRDPLITECIDKYRFKDYVRRTIGEEYVVPLVGRGMYESIEDIDFNELPESFVLKSTWGSGSRHVIIVRDKSKIDENQTKMTMSEWILPWENVYYETLDWGYKDIEPRIISEELIKNKIVEYKVFCFDGVPKFLYIAKDSAPGLRNRRDFYSTDWEWLPVKRGSENFSERQPRPKNLDTILGLSRKLSAPFPHVRVDIVDTENGLLAEELTFYTGSGEHAFEPEEWDLKFGEFFNLPTENLVF